MLDFETTGFPKSPGVVSLEGSAIVLDKDLNELSTLGPIVIHATEDELSHLGDFMRDIHTKTGLL